MSILWSKVHFWSQNERQKHRQKRETGQCIRMTLSVWTLLPGIFLSNMRSLTNKLDELYILLGKTETLLYLLLYASRKCGCVDQYQHALNTHCSWHCSKIKIKSSIVRPRFFVVLSKEVLSIVVSYEYCLIRILYSSYLLSFIILLIR